MNQSSFLKLNWRDFGKGLVVAVITAVLGALVPIFNNNLLPTQEEYKTIGVLALNAFAGYLLKNLFSNSDGQPLRKG